MGAQPFETGADGEGDLSELSVAVTDLLGDIVSFEYIRVSEECLVRPQEIVGHTSQVEGKEYSRAEYGG